MILILGKIDNKNTNCVAFCRFFSNDISQVFLKAISKLFSEIFFLQMHRRSHRSQKKTYTKILRLNGRLHVFFTLYVV
jgi:hypothetical protein